MSPLQSSFQKTIAASMHVSFPNAVADHVALGGTSAAQGVMPSADVGNNRQ